MQSTISNVKYSKQAAASLFAYKFSIGSIFKQLPTQTSSLAALANAKPPLFYSIAKEVL